MKAEIQNLINEYLAAAEKIDSSETVEFICHFINGRAKELFLEYFMPKWAVEHDEDYILAFFSRSVTEEGVLKNNNECHWKQANNDRVIGLLLLAEIIKTELKVKRKTKKKNKS